eukprot:CAMPEP_0114231588 /NCGR_PEP_ID=MMETSP0058-20121206/4130_1 /TAXON_ID=36894 /ORGANISM="Pyramimonas parkeae, CCMP726" /LENGTH=311 /DNA_ID=CAMNT_0001342959 /DNA_START=24 /DNA_END=959 /DNA_ORIENTATION=+
MESPQKRTKGECEKIESLDGFCIIRVLSEDTLTKRVSVLGRFEGREGEAVVTAQRRHIARETLPRMLSKETKTTLHFHNDIYTKYDADVPNDLSQVSIDLIYPATQKHIDKATDQKFVMVSETAELYKTVTLPYINNLPQASIQWVYNILEKKAELERLIFEDSDPDIGFMMHPDLKWDQQDLESLYCLVICNRRDVKSIRDLNDSHLPLLLNIRDKGMEMIQTKYGVQAHYLRVFVHYQPSYYHFHVHFVHTAYVGGNGIAVGKAYLLDDIIDNIQNISSDYYAKKTLQCHMGEAHPLLSLLRKTVDNRD